MEIRFVCDAAPRELKQRLCEAGTQQGYTPAIRKRDYVLDVHISYQWRTGDQLPITCTSSREVCIGFMRSRLGGLYQQRVFSVTYRYPVTRREYGEEASSTFGKVHSFTVSLNGQNGASAAAQEFLRDLSSAKNIELSNLVESTL